MPGAFLRSKARAASEIESVMKFHDITVMLTQAIRADEYRGKHVHFSGDVKADHIEPQAGLMIGILVTPPKKLSERWHQKRIERVRQEKLEQGTHDWMRYETSISVPANAQYIHFGLILHGTGQIWLANAQLEVIQQDEMPSA